MQPVVPEGGEWSHAAVGCRRQCLPLRAGPGVEPPWRSAASPDRWVTGRGGQAPASADGSAAFCSGASASIGQVSAGACTVNTAHGSSSPGCLGIHPGSNRNDLRLGVSDLFVAPTA